MSKNKNQQPAAVIPTLPLTEVWAVTTFMPDCHADDCGCDAYQEGTAVVGLFANEQTAKQFADRKNGGNNYGTFYAHKMPVHTSMKSLY